MTQRPRPLSRKGLFDVDPFNHDATNYDVTKDGQRFIMLRRTTDPARDRRQLDVIVNWTEELKRLAREKQGCSA